MSSKEDTSQTTTMEENITLNFSPKKIKYTQAFEEMKNRFESKILNLNQNAPKIGNNIKEVIELRKEVEERGQIFLEMKK